MNHNITRICAFLMAVMLMSACERASQNDPRNAFVGDYSFTSNGSIDLFYADSLKFITVPMSEKGEMSIVLATEPNDVWIIAENDTSLGHISGNYLFIDSLDVVETFGKIDMNLSFKYGKATLSHDTLSFPTDVVITASYQDKNLSGVGKVDVVAIKK